MHKTYIMYKDKNMHGTHNNYTVETLHSAACIKQEGKWHQTEMGICQLCSMQLQKEVKCNPKQSSCKKCAATRKPWCKRCESMGWPKNGCDGRIMAYNHNSGEFGAKSCGESYTNSLIFLPLSHHHSHFWATLLDFTTFHHGFVGVAHFFSQVGCFGLWLCITFCSKQEQTWGFIGSSLKMFYSWVFLQQNRIAIQMATAKPLWQQPLFIV